MSFEPLPVFEIVNKIAEGVRKFNEDYERSIPVLKRYYWNLSPHIRITTLKKIFKVVNGRPISKVAIDEIMVWSYEERDFLTIHSILEKIRKSRKYMKRKGIILACLEAIPVLEKAEMNSSSILLPTLIIQFDAMLSDYLAYHKVKIPKKAYKAKDNSENRINLVLNELRRRNVKPMDKVVLQNIDKMLFENSRWGRPYMKSLNRHYIIHGNIHNYGKKENLYRLISMIDSFYLMK